MWNCIVEKGIVELRERSEPSAFVRRTYLLTVTFENNMGKSFASIAKKQFSTLVHKMVLAEMRA